MTQNKVIPLPNADQIEEEASIWVTRIAEGNMSVEDAEALHKWLNQSAKHAETFETLAQFWGGLDFVQGLNDYAHSVTAEKSFHEEKKAYQQQQLRTFSVVALAACLCLTIGATIFYRISNMPKSYDGIYETAIGVQQQIDLPDGTQITLNTDSRINVNYTKDKRVIRLTRGEAYFDVAPNPERTFSVVTDVGVVTALGTEFSVRLSSELLDVVVTEGRVALTQETITALSPPPIAQLDAGQATVFNRAKNSVSTIAAVEIEEAVDWRDGELFFNGETLEQVIAELQRYTEINIEIADDSLKQQQIVAYYKVGNLDRMFDALNVMSSIEIEKISDDHIRLHKADQL
ncbi:MAG: FecR domain-containing protein [Pseudomonadota bacterium]